MELQRGSSELINNPYMLGMMQDKSDKIVEHRNEFVFTESEKSIDSKISIKTDAPMVNKMSKF